MKSDSLAGTLIATFRAIAEKGLAEEERALTHALLRGGSLSATYRHVGRKEVWCEVLAAVDGSERGCLFPSQTPAPTAPTGE